MTITTLADGTFEFKEVYNAINLKSANGEQFSICMRDTGFEFTYEGKTFVAKNKLLGPTKQVKTNISESNVSWVANNLSKDLVTNTQCIILLTQLLQLLRKQFVEYRDFQQAYSKVTDDDKRFDSRMKLIANFLSVSDLHESLVKKEEPTADLSELKSNVVYVDTREEFKALYTELAIPYMLSKDKNFKGTSPYSNTFSTNTITVTLKTK